MANFYNSMESSYYEAPSTSKVNIVSSNLPYDAMDTQDYQPGPSRQSVTSNNMPYDLPPAEIPFGSSPKPFPANSWSGNVSHDHFNAVKTPIPLEITSEGYIPCGGLPAFGMKAGVGLNSMVVSGIEAQRCCGAEGNGGIGHGEASVLRRCWDHTAPTVPIHPSLLPTAMAAPAADFQPPKDEVADAAHLFATLNEYLNLEQKFQPKLCLPVDDQQGEVSTGARDGAAHVMRCLKVWFDLSPDVLFHAINLLDRFLTKMKVRPWHVPCITVSCMNIAIDHRASETHQPRSVSIEELVSISQSTCTTRDVVRMSRVIEDKLSLAANRGPVTSLHWLRLFYRALPNTSVQCKEEELLNLLEIAACDYTCANTRSCELALVLLYHKLEGQLIERSRASAELPEDVYNIYDLFAHLQHICHMSDASLMSSRASLANVSARYERGATSSRQRLVWTLSERTLKVLRPTDRLTSLLPTIQEQQLNTVETTPPRKRSGSESSTSEETNDWPRSPVLPVYCES